jgi:hypothetical protein
MAITHKPNADGSASIQINGADRIVFSSDGKVRITSAQSGNALDVASYGQLKIIDTAMVSSSTSSTLTSVIPGDGTIPQSTEGTQILSASITPKSTTNKIRVSAVVFGSPVTANASVVAALFSSMSANAIGAGYQTQATTGFEVCVCPIAEHVPGVTTAVTYSVRVGATVGNTYINGNSSGNPLSVLASCLVLEEIQA